MSKIVVIPAFEQPQACADVLTKLSWFLSSISDSIDEISIFGTFDTLPDQVSQDLDPAILQSEASSDLLKKLELEVPPANPAALRQRVMRAAAVVVWRKAGTAALLAGLPQDESGPKVVMIDETDGGHASNRLSILAKALAPKRASSIEQSRSAYRAFKRSLDKKTGYLIGGGASRLECLRLPLDDGHVIVSNELILDQTLMEAVKPIAVAVADSGHYAIPTRRAGAFRAALREQMESNGLWLLVSMKDYPLYLSALPADLHDRVIGLPVHNTDRLSLNLEVDFSVAGLSDVMTRFMLPLAGSLFNTIRICGLDGTPAAGVAEASAEGEDQASDSSLEVAGQIDRIARELERAGKRVEGYTASAIPALRRRGAAAPLDRSSGFLPGEDTTLLSINPDLRDRIGHFWNYERRLGPKTEAGGLRYQIATSVEWAETADEGESDGEGGDATTFLVDCSLYTYSWTLSNRPDESPDNHSRVAEAVREEFTAAVDRGLGRCKGQLHVYMYCGSLEHAGILYEIALERPRVSLQVNLFWFRSADAWMPWFLDRWLWLLKAADQDPRLTITCMTAHQRRQIQGRSGISLPVAAHPSPLLDDEQAWSMLSEPLPERKKKRIFFPSTNRPEKGTGLLYDAARLLVDAAGDQDLELIFRTSPIERRAKLERDPIYPYVTLLDGHIEESQFIAILRSCHAVVLPYMPPNFADRTSGLVIDALYAGTPSVVVRGTFLAEIAQRFGSGLVVDRGTAEEIAEAVLKLLDTQKEAAWDFRESGKLYFRSNSWQRLATGIVKSSAEAETYAVPREAPESEEPAVSLLGSVPRAQAGAAHPLAALKLCLSQKNQLPASFDMLDARRDIVLQLISSDGKGLTVTTSKRAQGLADERLRSHHPELASRMHIEALSGDLDAQALQDQVGAYCDMAKIKALSLLVCNRADLADTAAALICQRRATAALIAFDDSRGSDHAEAAKLLAQAGYLVCIAEDHPLSGNESRPHFRRLAAYPFVSDLPWARGSIVALPQDLALTAVKTAFLETGQNLDYRASRDPQEIGAEILDNAKAAPAESVLAAAELPNADWQLAGFEFQGVSDDGFARLGETEALRIHRTAIRGNAEAGKPLTFSIELTRYERRFLCLWLSDAKGTSFVEAVFDMEVGFLVNLSTTLERDAVFAAAVPCDEREDGSLAFKAWVSVAAFPESELVQAQVTTRSRASGPRQHAGDPLKGLMARRFLLETNATPSLFPDGPAGAKGRPGRRSGPNPGPGAGSKEDS